MIYSQILLVILCRWKTEAILGVEVDNQEYFQTNTDNHDLYYTEVEDPSESDFNWDHFDFSDFYENFVNNNQSIWERQTRRNEFIPFNSLTFGEGGAAESRFKSKDKDKNKNRNKNKYEWWKKQKVQQKKKKHKNKTQLSSTASPTRSSSTTAPKRTTTRRRTTTAPTFVTTWFPTKSKTTTVNYFSRPLDYQKPVKTVWWSQTGNEIYNSFCHKHSFSVRMIYLPIVSTLNS